MDLLHKDLNIESFIISKTTNSVKLSLIFIELTKKKKSAKPLFHFLSSIMSGYSSALMMTFIFYIKYTSFK